MGGAVSSSILELRCIDAESAVRKFHPPFDRNLTGDKQTLLTFGRIASELDAAARLTQEVGSKLRGLLRPIVCEPGDDRLVAAELRRIRSSQAVAYQELSSTGFGRVVLFRTANGEVQLWRIGQANVSEFSIQLLNRLAPVARMLIPARVGDIVELPNVGPVTVIEVTGLGGFTMAGPDFDVAKVVDEFGTNQITHLRLSLDRWVKDAKPRADHPGPTQAPVASGSSTTTNVPRREGMDSSFYISTTRAQEDILGASERGYLLVNGIAGSGKTAIALGRTKALCDARFERANPAEHYFQPELCRGFVLRPSLIEYLKSTCVQLQLATMPIQDMDSLRIQLSQHFSTLLRLRTSSHVDGYEWDTDQLAGASTLNSLSFLKKLDQLLFESWCSKAAAALLAPMELPSDLPADTRAAIAAIRTRAAEKIEGLERTTSAGATFRCHRLVMRLIDIGRDATGLARKYGEQEAPLWWRLPDNRIVPTGADSYSFRARPVQPFEQEIFRSRPQAQAIQKARTQLRDRMMQDLLLAKGRTPDIATLLGDAVEASCDDASERNVIWSMLERHSLSTPMLDALLAIACLLTEGCDGIQTLHLRSIQPARHIFIDEYQDFTDLELLLMALQSDPSRSRSMTLSGDPLQRLSSQVNPSLAPLLAIGSSPTGSDVFLGENLRQSKPLADVSLAFRIAVLGDKSAENLTQVASFGDLIDPYRMPSAIDDHLLVSAILATPSTQSSAVIFASSSEAERWYKKCRPLLDRKFRRCDFSEDSRDLVKTDRIHFTTADAAKGLEFDAVLVFDPDAFLEIHGCGDAALYVAMSRGRNYLAVLERSESEWVNRRNL